MSFWTYILYSESTDAYYKGQTNDLHSRMIRHNARRENFTSAGVPWQLIWSKGFESRSEAVKLERKLKNMSREKLRKFMKHYSDFVVGPDTLT